MKVCAVILGGGSGSRMGAKQNKIFLPLRGVPAIVRAAAPFTGLCAEAVVVARPEERDEMTVLLRRYGLDSFVKKVVPGGSTRQESVRHGLDALPGDTDIVLIHDGARALVTEDVIRRAMESAAERGSGVAAIPVTDTIKRAGDDGRALETLNRDELRAMQTPQAFRAAAASPCPRIGGAGRLSGHRRRGPAGTRRSARLPDAGGQRKPETDHPGGHGLRRGHSDPSPGKGGAGMIRIGHGMDVHRLVEGRKLILCGVEIPHTLGLLGHSDADVAAHALMDALLGAAALGDIGKLFPDTDERYRGADSLMLLDRVMEALGEAGYRPVNADVTIVAQKPKLRPYIDQMRVHLARHMGVDVSQVSVKATTSEGMGFEGEEKGMTAHAVCLIESI